MDINGMMGTYLTAALKIILVFKSIVCRQIDQDGMQPIYFTTVRSALKFERTQMELNKIEDVEYMDVTGMMGICPTAECCLHWFQVLYLHTNKSRVS